MGAKGVCFKRLAKDLKRKEVVVAGSLAFDDIMITGASYKDQIIPDKLDKLNFSVVLDDYIRGFGGTAGNIAYNLNHFNLKHSVISILGRDGGRYLKRFRKVMPHTDISCLALSRSEKTSRAIMGSDSGQRQIIHFLPGPSSEEVYGAALQKLFADKEPGLFIISPTRVPFMKMSFEACVEHRVPYIFDPGQEVNNFNHCEFSEIVSRAFALICNEYEFEMTKRHLAECPANLPKLTVVTKAKRGAMFLYRVSATQKSFHVPAAAIYEFKDGTGAGDAFRAGLIYGLKHGWSLVKTARFASTAASYAVEHKLAQDHKYARADFYQRYFNSYNRRL